MRAASLVQRSVATLMLLLAIAVMHPRGQAPAMRIVLLGTGAGPRPSAERAGPSAWIEAGSERLFVDAGRSVVERLAQAGLEPSAVRRLFLTHLHSDHVVGLPDL